MSSSIHQEELSELSYGFLASDIEETKEEELLV